MSEPGNPSSIRGRVGAEPTCPQCKDEGQVYVGSDYGTDPRYERCPCCQYAEHRYRQGRREGRVEAFQAAYQEAVSGRFNASERVAIGSVISSAAEALRQQASTPEGT